MSTSPVIRKHADTGLLYLAEGDEATIVGCTALQLSQLEIPPVLQEGDAQYRVVAVGEAAFSYMSGLQSLRLPVTLCRIGHGAFEGTGLAEVQLHCGMQTLSPYAFFGCEHLRRVELPADGLCLEEQAFGGCPALKREQISNLAAHSEEELSRAGLPAPVPEAAPTYVVVNGAAPADETPLSRQLLEKGVALEEADQTLEAAAVYMQLHGQRAALGFITNAERQVSDLKAIAEAEFRLALLLKFGLAPERNPDGTPRPTAASLLQQILDTNALADAAYHLGDLYAGGYDVPADPGEAIRLLKSAAGKGHARACLDLGYIYLHGTLEAANPRSALFYFRKCAELDSPYAPIAREEMQTAQHRALMDG